MTTAALNLGVVRAKWGTEEIHGSGNLIRSFFGCAAEPAPDAVEYFRGG
jgi:hypothetical protein